MPSSAPPFFRHSLLARLLAALLAALAVGVAALFVGLDTFVSGHFQQRRTEQINRASDEVKRFVANEGERLVGLAVLLAKDTDLNHSTFYHLFLAGERDHPQAAVERIARAFALESVSLWDETGRRIAVVPAPTTRPRSGQSLATKTDSLDAAGGTFASPPPIAAAPGSWLLNENGHAWIVADAPLLREGATIAVLRIARPLANALAAGLPALYPAVLRVVEDGRIAKGAMRIDMPPVTLELHVPDTAAQALAGAKAVLVVILLGGGLLLGVFLAVYLHRKLKPLAALAEAANAVGRGDFSRRVAIVDDTEVGQLAVAFNAMTADLAQMRELERRLAHQEQLSAIGRVAARVAHDINNPLTVIANTAQLALKPPPVDPQLAEDLRRIVHHGERCMRTLELLLDYARPVRINIAPFDLAEVARTMGTRWKTAVLADRPVAVEADRMQIEQLLDNLLTNARDAAGPDGKVEITVTAGDREAVLTVRDSGPGFSPAARERLFEPFHTTKTGGTGLGLASALAIARAHGGDLEIGPAGEVGGQVILRLPSSHDQTRLKVEAPR